MDNLKEQLNKSVELAHLELESSEKEWLLADLQEILSFVQVIKKAEEKGGKKYGKNIPPEGREFPQTCKKNVLREDIIDPFNNTKGITKEFPQKKDNLIQVKKI